MIYGLTTWEKPDLLQPGLLTNGNTVVIQRKKITTSQGGLVIGSASTFIGASYVIYNYIEKGSALNLDLLFANLLPGVITLFGILLITKSKEGIRLRNEHGGVHPEDTLLVFDGSKKILTRQRGTAEETLTTFENLTLEIRVLLSGKQDEFRIIAKYPQGTETVARYATKKLAENMLQNIKERLGL